MAVRVRRRLSGRQSVVSDSVTVTGSSPACEPEFFTGAEPIPDGRHPPAAGCEAAAEDFFERRYQAAAPPAAPTAPMPATVAAAAAAAAVAAAAAPTPVTTTAPSATLGSARRARRCAYRKLACIAIPRSASSICRSTHLVLRERFKRFMGRVYITRKALALRCSGRTFVAIARPPPCRWTGRRPARTAWLGADRLVHLRTPAPCPADPPGCWWEGSAPRDSACGTRRCRDS